MILYFSGTGNSKHIAGLISMEIKDTVFSINDGIKYNHFPSPEKSEVLIFCLPTYAWRIPRIVSRWIMECPAFFGQKAYFLMTCGGGIGNAEKYLKKLCSAKDLNFMGCAEIVMPENYIAMYDCPDEKESERIVETADKLVMKIIPKIQNGQMLEKTSVTGGDKIKSSIINDVFYPFCVGSKKYFTTDACIGCGECEKRCPTNNILIKDCRPVWGNDCTHCMACICYCPTEAIEYGKISMGKRRYQCP